MRSHCVCVHWCTQEFMCGAQEHIVREFFTRTVQTSGNTIEELVSTHVHINLPVV